MGLSVGGAGKPDDGALCINRTCAVGMRTAEGPKVDPPSRFVHRNACCVPSEVARASRASRCECRETPFRHLDPGNSWELGRAIAPGSTSGRDESWGAWLPRLVALSTRRDTSRKLLGPITVPFVLLATKRSLALWAIRLVGGRSSTQDSGPVSWSWELPRFSPTGGANSQSRSAISIL